MKTKSLKKTFSGHTAQVNTICQLDDKYIASGSMDHTVKLISKFERALK